jgi:hypothetical protein
MSTAELIDAIQALSPSQQKEVEQFLKKLTDENPSTKAFDEAAKSVFTQHQKLLSELAK